MNFTPLYEYLSTLEHAGLPMFDVSVYRNHEEIFRMRSGFRDRQKTVPLSGDDIYWLYSTSKPVTCTAALQLVTQGKLSLDTPLADIIPEYRTMLIKEKSGKLTAAENPILIRHLFTMTSGLSYDLRSPSLLKAYTENPNADTLTLVRALAGDPLSFEPGTHFLYSLSHDVLAAAVEVVSGEAFGDYLKSHLFDPLGIEHMGFSLPKELEPLVVEPYTYDTPTNQAQIRPEGNPYIFTPNYESGGAGLYATVSDYALFADALASGGVGKTGARILSPEGVKMMQENLLPPAALRDFRTSPRKYGYGWGLCGRVHMDPVVSRAESPAGEFGWDGAAGAYVLVDPEHQLSIFFGTRTHSCTYAYEIIHPTVRNLVVRAVKEG